MYLFPMPWLFNMAPKEKEEGLDPPFLGGTSAMEFVPVLIAKLKSGSDCGIDFFSFLFFMLKLSSQASCQLVMYSYHPILTQRETHILAIWLPK